MTSLAHWVHTPFAQALGWTLVHFLWEGAALAAMLMALLRLQHGAPARRRYTIAALFLASMPLAFAATLAILWARQPVSVPIPAGPLVWIPAAALAIQPPAPPRFSFAGILDRLAWLAPLWIAGVAFCYARSAAAWLGVRRLRRRGVCAPPPAWQARLQVLAARLRVTRPVELLESCLTDAPVLLGYLRPVILLPVGCLTGLSPAQVECILLHELAHVVRHDYLVNLLQSLVEGLLFYHPAVWWTSHVVRAERENCCDDRVVELVGDARRYAATLAVLEQRRAPEAALAATGGNLMKRIRRLTTESRAVRNSPAPAATAGLLLVVFAAALAALPVARHASAPHPRGVALAPAAAPAQAPADPYRKWLKEEVVYIITDQERAAFKGLTTDEERENFIEQFWLRRDPTPGTPENEFREEHYRRIAYADEHFLYQDVSGWKSDRGRIYITYGPPDEIDDHSSGGAYQRPPEEGGGEATTNPFQQWRYRYIEGIGTNVIIEFIDPGRTGEFRMTMDPSEKEVPRQVAAAAQQTEPRPVVAAAAAATDSKVFVSRDQPQVSVIVADRSTASAGVIAPGDVLNILRVARSSQDEAAIAEKQAECAALLNKYQADFPAVRECQDKVRTLEQAGADPQVRQQLAALQNEEALQAQVSAERLSQLRKQKEQIAKQLNESQSAASAEAVNLERAKEEYARALQMGGDSDAAKQAKKKMDDSEYLLAASSAVRQSWAGKLQEQLDAASQGIAEQQQAQALLELTRNSIRVQQSLRTQVRGAVTHSTVGADGKVAIDGLGQVAATGLTPEQLQAAIGPGSTVAIEESRYRAVTVVVQLGASGGSFHVFGEVMVPSKRIVASFEANARNAPAVAKNLFLRPGTYHLQVIVKNQAKGDAKTTNTDFTVD